MIPDPHPSQNMENSTSVPLSRSHAFTSSYSALDPIISLVQSILYHCPPTMNFISRQVVGCGKRALRDSCRRSAVLSANYGIIVDRCVIGTSASTFQRRHASSEPPRSLATCLVSEIAGEDETTPSAEFIEIVNEIEKTFKIIDEPGRGTFSRAAQIIRRNIANFSLSIPQNVSQEL